MLSKAHFQTALVALAAFAVVAFVQKSVMQVPLVGKYLPGGL